MSGRIARLNRLTAQSWWLLNQNHPSCSYGHPSFEVVLICIEVLLECYCLSQWLNVVLISMIHSKTARVYSAGKTSHTLWYKLQCLRTHYDWAVWAERKGTRNVDLRCFPKYRLNSVQAWMFDSRGSARGRFGQAEKQMKGKGQQSQTAGRVTRHLLLSILKGYFIIYSPSCCSNQTSMSFFVLLNTKEDILKNVSYQTFFFFLF